MNRAGLEGRQISTNGRRGAQAAVGTKSSNRRREIDQAALAHAWDWFALHARQRMQCVNFFFLAVAFLATAYGTAMTKDLHALAVGICVLGILISHYFHRLDQRTRALVDAGRKALRPFQQRLAHETNIQELEILKGVEQKKKGTSYSDILRMLHWTTIFAFLVGGLYALYLAGVRLCLTV
jgi:cytochrome b561